MNNRVIIGNKSEAEYVRTILEILKYNSKACVQFIEQNRRKANAVIMLISGSGFLMSKESADTIQYIKFTYKVTNNGTEDTIEYYPKDNNIRLANNKKCDREQLRKLIQTEEVKKTETATSGVRKFYSREIYRQ